ncbi:hypothetical protein BC834DRAFT_874556 [Gloeopeniophorella convolvens]|nr:hypothetical protein BC834DRAFT_874556 [Gloeopeniophorella convolvens]
MATPRSLSLLSLVSRALPVGARCRLQAPSHAQLPSMPRHCCAARPERASAAGSIPPCVACHHRCRFVVSVLTLGDPVGWCVLRLSPCYVAVQGQQVQREAHKAHTEHYATQVRPVRALQEAHRAAGVLRGRHVRRGAKFECPVGVQHTGKLADAECGLVREASRMEGWRRVRIERTAERAGVPCNGASAVTDGWQGGVRSRRVLIQTGSCRRETHRWGSANDRENRRWRRGMPD